MSAVDHGAGLKKKKKPSPFLECLAFQCLSFYLPQVMYLVSESPSTSRETDSEVRNVYALSGHIHSPFILTSSVCSASLSPPLWLSVFPVCSGSALRQLHLVVTEPGLTRLIKLPAEPDPVSSLRLCVGPFLCLWLLRICTW